MDDRILDISDDNIESLRERYPNGLHFVVGDTHGEFTTLRCLMDKIHFDSTTDHVYFLGDYNEGGDPYELLCYISQYYRENYSVPGFHLIRGNHERELFPCYSLENLPDILVVKGRALYYYLTHAGMVKDAFDIITPDINASPDEKTHAYALRKETACFNAPLGQVTWSRRGLYSQRSRYHVWPSLEYLHSEKACIIHGHTPFSMMKKGDYFSYGDEMLFWSKQRIWFAEDLSSFNIDSNIKGRYNPEDSYRGLSCICLEVLDEIAERNGMALTRDGIRHAENFVFSVPYVRNTFTPNNGDIRIVLDAKPNMKQICLSKDGVTCYIK